MYEMTLPGGIISQHYYNCQQHMDDGIIIIPCILLMLLMTAVASMLVI